MIETTERVVSYSVSTAKTHDQHNSPIWLAKEGLMAHYFSPARQNYASKDVQWFLNFANIPRQWCLQRVTLAKDDWTVKQKKLTHTQQTEVHSK